jgi:hypothetical protein
MAIVLREVHKLQILELRFSTCHVSSFQSKYHRIATTTVRDVPYRSIGDKVEALDMSQDSPSLPLVH